MFEVLVFIFENYSNHQMMPKDDSLVEELSQAGFKHHDILGAFDWYKQLTQMMSEPVVKYTSTLPCLRVYTALELKKIDTESLSFILFLEQAKVIAPYERDLIIDRAMALHQQKITIEETRWITMMALWNDNRKKDYLFVEDAIFNPRGLTLH